MTDRELDALCAEKIFGLEILARDWPCGWSPDGGEYEAAISLLAEDIDDWLTDRGPVYRVGNRPMEEVPWPEPVSFNSTTWDGVMLVVEPVPFYSTTWNGAGAVVEKMRGRGYVFRLYWDPDEPCIADFEGEERVGANDPVPARAIVLAALRAKGVEVGNDRP